MASGSRRSVAAVALGALLLSGCTSPVVRFYRAIRAGDVGRAEGLLDSHPWLANARRHGVTPLHVAADCTDREGWTWLAFDADLVPRSARPRDALRVVQAIAAGRERIVELLLARGADVNRGTDEREVHWSDTPLDVAARTGSAKVVELLLARSAEFGCRSHDGPTLVQPGGLVEAMQAEFRRRSHDGYTPLHWAAELGRPRIVDLLIARGASVHARGPSGNTPLHAALGRRGPSLMMGDMYVQPVRVLTGCVAFAPAVEDEILNGEYYDDRYGMKEREDAEDEVVRLLLAHGADPNTRNDAEQTPLHLAAAHSTAAIVERLLSRGADLGAVDCVGAMPLHEAAARGSKEVVDLLLSKGARVDTRDSEGRTPLHRAAERGAPEILRLLLAKGAQIAARDHKGRTPLHCAASEANLRAAAFLLTKGADPNAKSDDGSTPLHAATDAPVMGYDRENMVQALLWAGADPNAADKRGRTPLHYAAGGETLRHLFTSEEVTTLLLIHGANVDAADKHGKTPLSVAEETWRKEVADLLKKHGAKR